MSELKENGLGWGTNKMSFTSVVGPTPYNSEKFCKECFYFYLGFFWFLFFVSGGFPLSRQGKKWACAKVRDTWGHLHCESTHSFSYVHPKRTSSVQGRPDFWHVIWRAKPRPNHCCPSFRAGDCCSAAHRTEQHISEDSGDLPERLGKATGKTNMEGAWAFVIGDFLKSEEHWPVLKLTKQTIIQVVVLHSPSAQAGRLQAWEQFWPTVRLRPARATRCCLQNNREWLLTLRS